MAAPEQFGITRRPIAHLRWWIGAMLFASTVINYIDRQTLSLLAPVIGMFLVLLLLRNNEATEQGLVRRL